MKKALVFCLLMGMFQGGLASDEEEEEILEKAKVRLIWSWYFPL